MSLSNKQSDPLLEQAVNNQSRKRTRKRERHSPTSSSDSSNHEKSVEKDKTMDDLLSIMTESEQGKPSRKRKVRKRVKEDSIIEQVIKEDKKSVKAEQGTNIDSIENEVESEDTETTDSESVKDVIEPEIAEVTDTESVEDVIELESTEPTDTESVKQTIEPEIRESTDIGSTENDVEPTKDEDEIEAIGTTDFEPTKNKIGSEIVLANEESGDFIDVDDLEDIENESGQWVDEDVFEEVLDLSGELEESIQIAPNEQEDPTYLLLQRELEQKRQAQNNGATKTKGKKRESDKEKSNFEKAASFVSKRFTFGYFEDEIDDELEDPLLLNTSVEANKRKRRVRKSPDELRDDEIMQEETDDRRYDGYYENVLPNDYNETIHSKKPIYFIGVFLLILVVSIGLAYWGVSIIEESIFSEILN